MVPGAQSACLPCTSQQSTCKGSGFAGRRGQSVLPPIWWNSGGSGLVAECIDALFAGDLHHLGFVHAAPIGSSDGNGWGATGTLRNIWSSYRQQVSNFVTQAEMTAAQRTQLDQMRLQHGGEGGGGVSARATSRDSTRGKGVPSSPQAPPEQGQACQRSKRDVKDVVGCLITLVVWRGQSTIQSMAGVPPR